MTSNVEAPIVAPDLGCCESGILLISNVGSCSVSAIAGIVPFWVCVAGVSFDSGAGTGALPGGVLVVSKTGCLRSPLRSFCAFSAGAFSILKPPKIRTGSLPASNLYSPSIPVVIEYGLTPSSTVHTIPRDVISIVALLAISVLKLTMS